MLSGLIPIAIATLDRAAAKPALYSSFARLFEREITEEK
jgi:hypothetical protein